MCLAVPGRLVEVRDDRQEGRVDLHGNRLTVSTLLVPEATVGDWVLVHAGFAIQRLDRDEAEAVWSVIRDLARRTDEAEASPAPLDEPLPSVLSPGVAAHA